MDNVWFLLMLAYGLIGASIGFVFLGMLRRDRAQALKILEVDGLPLATAALVFFMLTWPVCIGISFVKLLFGEGGGKDDDHE